MQPPHIHVYSGTYTLVYLYSGTYTLVYLYSGIPLLGYLYSGTYTLDSGAGDPLPCIAYVYSYILHKSKLAFTNEGIQPNR